jgi:hypothetical protein
MWGEGHGNTMREATWVFVRDRRIDEPHPLTMAAKRECRDGVAAILASKAVSLLDGLTMKKSPKIASMLILPTEMP